ncbi:HAD family hydrolase [Solimicrobium silvestre]|uniref:Haloacid dehalogenase-like hydrolase n=1 Tax=Solimicrobium silvestre TaxID=2099400 RepID=A0A2S9GTL9_9BURK|nr:HAD family hydrolase [Solimicrobium silvestre]PRC91051.1 Haloacid dehalogenase-like hydrolase [Solimicrobium silvestre]
MSAPEKIVFLLDVDNTLLDGDRIISDIDSHFYKVFGDEGRLRYWAIAESLRLELGYVDYLGAVQRFRSESKEDPRILMLSSFFLDYPFAERLYPRALDLLNHLLRWGNTVIVSDGDMIFQPRKIQRSGLWDAVEGRVLIYQHKEKMLEDIEQRFPSHHYVMVDDKLQILTAMKKIWHNRLTTIFPRQGHYALDPANIAAYPAADMSIEYIADLINTDVPALLHHTPLFTRNNHDGSTF